jgi:hypothetical protein
VSDEGLREQCLGFVEQIKAGKPGKKAGYSPPLPANGSSGTPRGYPQPRSHLPLSPLLLLSLLSPPATVLKMVMKSRNVPDNLIARILKAAGGGGSAPTAVLNPAELKKKSKEKGEEQREGRAGTTAERGRGRRTMTHLPSVLFLCLVCSLLSFLCLLPFLLLLRRHPCR